MLSIRRHVYALLNVPDACALLVIPYGERSYRRIGISTISLDPQQGGSTLGDQCSVPVLELVLNKVRTAVPAFLTVLAFCIRAPCSSSSPLNLIFSLISIRISAPRTSNSGWRIITRFKTAVLLIEEIGKHYSLVIYATYCLITSRWRIILVNRARW